jgi:hypothetical protein
VFGSLQLTSAYSRGEKFHGSDSTRLGYYGRQTQTQTQTQTQYQHSAYPQYQVQSQSFVNNRVKPEYYPDPQYRDPPIATQPIQYYDNNRRYPQNPIALVPPQSGNSDTQQFYDRHPYTDPLQPNHQFPISSPPNVYQTQQNSNLNNRNGVEVPQNSNADLTTRPTPSKKQKQQATVKPSPQSLLVNRFDDRTNAAFKKTLSFDSGLSDAMEKFSLRILDQFCLNNPQENFLISPFSIYHLLVLIAEGANGNTFKEITDQLELGTLLRTRDFQQYLSETLRFVDIIYGVCSGYIGLGQGEGNRTVPFDSKRQKSKNLFVKRPFSPMFALVQCHLV